MSQWAPGGREPRCLAPAAPMVVTPLENVRKKIKSKKKPNDAGFDDGGRIQEAERRSPVTRRVATSYI